MMDPSFYLMQYVNGFYFQILFLMLLFPYIFAYWRNDKESERDTQIGLKVLFSYFLFISYHLLLGTSAFLLAALFSGEISQVLRHTGPIVAVCAVVGVIVFATHKALLAKTNYVRFPRISRFYHGLNVLVVTSVSITSLMFIGFLVADGDGDEVGMPLGVLVVYGTAWAYFVSSLLKGDVK